MQLLIPGKATQWHLPSKLLIMKLTTICILITTLHASAISYSQKVTLSGKNISLSQVFRAISKQTGYEFVYDSKQLQNVSNVSFNLRSALVSEVLDQSLKNQPFKYTILDKTIVISARPLPPAPSPPPPITIKGRILNEKGEPVAGAAIMIKGAKQGTASNDNGEFSINVPDNRAILLISYVGYVPTEFAVKNQTQVSVQLNRDLNNMESVVVIGYGTQRKGEVTSAIASVKSENFVKGAVRDAAQLIQGKVAGLTVSTPSGDPTAGTQIQLRGITTLMASTAPLVLIDGVPGNLNSVAPEDIESIDVLKDGSAAAIYGTRGTNGVILITTRKTRGEQRPTIELSSYLSVQTIARKPAFLTADDYRKYIGQGVGFIDYGASTDWFKEISRSLPVSHTHNLTLLGGTKNTNYTASVNYRNWEGLFLKSDNQQMTGRFDINHSMLDGILKFNMNAIVRKRQYWSGGNGVSFNSYVYRQAVIRNPTDSIRNSKGDWMERGVYNYDNPLAYINETDGLIKEKEQRVSGSITLTPIRDLQIKLLLSNVEFGQKSGYAESKKHVSTVKNGRNGFASLGTNETKDNLLEFTTEYAKRFGDHRLVLLGGYSYQDSKTETSSMQNWDFPTDLYSYNRMQSGNALGRGEATMSSFASSSKLIGFFGRVNYNWNDKYLLMAAVRREGSSKFGVNHKWGVFPSVSAGWRLSKENFLSKAGFINDLKLRAGFGVTGIAPDRSYLSLTSLNYDTRGLYNDTWIQGLSPVRNPNADLRWERKEEVNIGLDFTLFKNRFSGTIDAYQRLTKDMLWDYQVPVPPYLYSTITANVGTMRNKGVEVLLNYTAIQQKDFEWNTSVNFSSNQNKLVSLSNDLFKTTNDFFDAGATGEPMNQPTHRVKIGDQIGNFYGWKSIDIDENGFWIIEGSDGKPKSIKLAKAEDKKILGNGLPKYYAGWNNTIRYKHWDLNILMRGAFGFQILNFQRMFYENPTVIQYNMLQSAFDPVYGKVRLKNDLQHVSYYMENGDYWKVDNITLGYTLPLKANNYIRSARFYLSGLNILTITGYKGIDPEVNRSGLAPGNDERDKYPSISSFSIGANLTF